VNIIIKKRFIKMEKRGKTLTTSSGMPIDNNQFSQTAGAKGPLLIQDFALIDKIAKFDRYSFIKIRH
jgi:catalase